MLRTGAGGHCARLAVAALGQFAKVPGGGDGGGGSLLPLASKPPVVFHVGPTI